MRDHKSPSWQHYPKQWLGDDNILLMSWEARGMHFHLMCIAWQQNPPCTLPDDDRLIRTWLHHPEDWDRLKEEIFRAWEKHNNRWVQMGLLRARNRQSEFSEKQSKNAKKRWKSLA